MKNLFIILRPKQWIKNLFIFIPLIFGKELFNYSVSLKVLIAFFLFCMMSSAVYIINDIIDIEEDKLHPRKHLRPISSGKVNIKQARLIVAVLIIFSILPSLYLETCFSWVLVVYFLLNLFYSMILKRIVIIDVFCIAIFFLLRVVAGTVISRVEFSYWMIFMIVLLALFLGFHKRRQELELYEEKARRFVLAKYDSYFIDQMIAVITSSIVVVYMLYTIDTRTVTLFGTRNLMYTIPFVYYGIFRYLYLVHKKKGAEDPTLVLFSDFAMQLNLLLWVFACVIVIYFKI